MSGKYMLSRQETAFKWGDTYQFRFSFEESLPVDFYALLCDYIEAIYDRNRNLQDIKYSCFYKSNDKTQTTILWFCNNYENEAVIIETTPDISEYDRTFLQHLADDLDWDICL